MGQPNEAPKPFESGVGRNLVLKHGLELKVSPEFLAKRNKLQSALSGSRVLEHKLKLKEGGEILGLRVDAANSDQEYDQQFDDETCCFNQEEKKAYCDTIDQCVDEKASSPEDKEALRRTVFERILKPDDYLAKFKHWQNRWNHDAGIRDKYPDFNDYALQRAKDFVRNRLKDLTASRLRSFQKNSMKDSGTEEQKKDQLDRIIEKVEKFKKAHQDELIECDTLDQNDPKRQKLFQKFLLESGITGAKMEDLRQLFDDLIGDAAAAYVVQLKLELNNRDMVGLATEAIDKGTGIDETRWNAAMQGNLQKDQYFKEAMQQQQAAVYQPGEGSGLNKAPLDSPEAVALQAGGLRITGYDASTGTYTLRYPDSTYEVEMKIDKPANAKTLDGATFIFYNKYADKAKGNKFSLQGPNLRSGCNQMYLDYLMNDWIRQNKASPDVNANDILNDETMLRMAERLFDRNLNDVVLTKNMRSIFTRFLEVLMAGDSADSPYGDLGSFQARVKKMDTVLMTPSNAKLLYKEFEKVGSVTFTISTLLQRINYKGA